MTKLLINFDDLCIRIISHNFDSIFSLKFIQLNVWFLNFNSLLLVHSNLPNLEIRHDFDSVWMSKAVIVVIIFNSRKLLACICCKHPSWKQFGMFIVLFLDRHIFEGKLAWAVRKMPKISLNHFAKILILYCIQGFVWMISINEARLCRIMPMSIKVHHNSFSIFILIRYLFKKCLNSLNTRSE